MRISNITYFLTTLLLTLLLQSCSEDDITGYETQDVYVSVTGNLSSLEGITVKLTDTHGYAYTRPTDATGVAVFAVPVGVYQASVSHSGEAIDGWRTIYNGATANVVVRRDAENKVTITITEAHSSAIIIRELYVGGCQNDDGSGWFHRDKYVIIANNSDRRVVLPGLCLAIATPYNSFTTNKNYDANGMLTYENEGFIPASSAFWFFQGNSVTFEPWEEKVIALNGAIDHTSTYSNSVNLAKAEYYCTYDIEKYNSTTFYPSPAEVIPTDHYLKVVKYGDEYESTWPLSNTSPALFIFTPPAGTTPMSFGTDADNVWYDEGRALPTFACRKVPIENVLDGVEVFSGAWDENYKRLTAAIDVGYVMFTSRQGHSIERRVDTIETQKQGHTVYVDTNNSTNDFVQREHASLRDR